MDRAAWLLILTLLAGTVLAGCATQDEGPGDQGSDTQPTTLYTHQWFYGPGYGGSTDLPVFEDAFEVPAGPDTLTVEIDWRIEAGQASVILQPPQGEPVNITSQEAGGPDGSHDEQLTAEEGSWGFRIETWRSHDGGFPEGQIDVTVTGR